MKLHAFLLLTFAILIVCFGRYSNSSKPKSYVEYISDPKEWKKLLRTRTNVLALYSDEKLTGAIMSTFSDVSRELRGSATLVQIDCAGEGKKLCKKNRIDIPNMYVLKHYKDGKFHKDYDRKETLSSMVTFLRDPAGDLPWDEDPIGEDVMHILDITTLVRLLKREKSMMIMFYAPWCGFCKRLKPDYSAAATELKGTHVLSAMDLNKPENGPARVKFNITGFPTLIYFENGAPKYTYEGENNKAGIVSFMRNPGPAKEKPKEESWADEKSDVVHLTDKTFKDFVQTHPSVVVMFYAPWCGHCKKMKPEFSEAATALKEKAINGVLAAVDSTKEKVVSSEFSIKGFPTIKYFKDGELTFDVSNLRSKDVIIDFMNDPKEPPAPRPSEVPWSDTPSPVVHLSEENFKPFLKKKKHVLVMFYAPWCGHCKKAKPEFTAAAEKFAEDAKVEFAAVDCTEHNNLCKSNDVRGYPTFLYFNYYKNFKPYNGGRSESDFMNFMNDPDASQSALPSSSDVNPAQEWEDLKGSEHLHMLTESNFDSFVKDKRVLVLFYAPWCGHCKAMKSDYALAAEQIKKESIDGYLAYVDATVEQSLSSRFQVKGYPTIKYFAMGTEVIGYKGARKASDFVSFMANPPVDKLDGKTEL